jgi:hypothetical protein
METIESQNKRIKEYLLKGKSLTPLDGLYQFGSLRLGARIFDLRKQGMKIKSEIIEVTSPSVYNGVKRVCRYSL